MAVYRGGGTGDVLAAGPTDLKFYLPLSLAVTGVVAGLPLWVAFGLGERLGFSAMLASIALSFALAHLGNYLWQRQPGSRDIVFNDLMLWGFIRRTVGQRRLARRIGRLGLDASDDPDQLTLEERTELIKKLAVALETGDPYTHGHSQRVARHAYMVAKALKLPKHTAEKIRLAGVIHDIGKLRTPREVITKPGKLTDAEFQIIKRHPFDGAEMVKILGDAELTDMVLHHHERLDGSGYPDRLPRDEISIGARVLAVADTFDALSSLRPYREAQKHKVALDILEKEAADGRLDPIVVEAFIRYYSGRRAWKWWAMVSTSPAQLYDVPMMIANRVGAASLANVAVVGVTAMALSAGSPLHGGFTNQEPERDRAKQVATAKKKPEAGKRSQASTLAGDSASQQSTTVTAGAPANSGTSGKSRRSRPAKGKPQKNGGGRPDQAGQPNAAAANENKGPKEDKGKPEHAGPPEREDELVAGSPEQPAAITEVPAVNDSKGPDKDPGTTAAETTEPVIESPETTTSAAQGNNKDKS